MNKFFRSCRLAAYFASSPRRFVHTRCRLQSSFTPSDAALESTLIGRKMLSCITSMSNDFANVSAFQPKRQTRNMPRLVRHALKEMLSNNSLVISPSDKNIGPAAATQSDYKTASLACFNSGWKEISHDEGVQIQSSFCSQSIHLLQQYGDFCNFHSVFNKPPDWFSFLLASLGSDQHDPKKRFACFYTLWKVHKTPVASRPIVPMTSHFTRSVSVFLHEQLQPVVNRFPTVLRASRLLLADLNRISGKIPATAVMAVRDVTSLYPSIPTHHGIAAVTWALDQYSSYSGFFKELIISLLRLVMESVTVKFGDQFFLQTDGTAMGSPVAVTYANIFMFWIERDHVSEFQHSGSLLLYRRFIDDVFSLFPDKNCSQHFWHTFDHCHEKRALQFELPKAKWIELTGPIAEKSVAFLDLQITLHSTLIQTELFQKQLNRFMFLPFSSAQPVFIKRAFLREELKRAITAFSDHSAFLDYRSKFLIRLLARGFPFPFIAQCWKDITYSLRPQLLNSAMAARDRSLTGQFSQRMSRVIPLTLPFDRRTQDLNPSRIIQNAWTTFSQQELDSLGKPLVSWTKVASLGLLFQSANRSRF